jgi:hypothetical protein
MKKEWLYVVLALAAGVVGGMLGRRLNGAAAVVASESAPKTLAAQEILLTGSNGKVRAALHMTKNGEPSLELFDHAGQTRIVLDIGPDETPGMRFYDLKRAMRLKAEVSSENVPTLRFFDEQSRLRALFGVDAEGEAAMSFYSTTGRILRELP